MIYQNELDSSIGLCLTEQNDLCPHIYHDKNDAYVSVGCPINHDVNVVFLSVCSIAILNMLSVTDNWNR